MDGSREVLVGFEAHGWCRPVHEWPSYPALELITDSRSVSQCFEARAVWCNEDYRAQMRNAVDTLARFLILGLPPRQPAEGYSRWLPRRFLAGADLLCELAFTNQRSKLFTTRVLPRQIFQGHWRLLTDGGLRPSSH